MMKRSGCDVTRSFFICEPCPPGMLIGGYWSTGRGVVVCENVERSTAQISRTMVHEMVHAYDYCTSEFDLNNCVHYACTEIRAANLSGDCNWTMELIRGRGAAFTKHKQACVKRMASLSLQSNPSCAANADRAVDIAFERCWKDLRPFDHVP
jgi:mitochondrial inner membrane protease ATP23